ncbi:MAG: EamA family transporter [Candidatus Bathyarchaeota archaeon]|nr:EamA family transporter [Candidatus Bathyarchaeota archaeon]
MDWLLFALLSPAFWAMNNVINKFLITKKFKGYSSMLIYLNFVDLIFAGAVYAFVPIAFNFPYCLFAMIIGLMPLLAFWFYSKSLMVEEVSRLAPLFQFIPIFVVFLSVMFLGELLSAQKYLGITLVVLTSILISYKKSEDGHSLSSAFKFMVPFTAIIAVYTVLNKFLLGYLDYWSVFFWMMIGSWLGVMVMLIFSKPRKAFVESVSHLGVRTFFITLAGEGSYILGTVFSLIATSLGFVSLVSALAGLQQFFVFVYMLFLSFFIPKILKEDISKNSLFLKIFAIALMFVGTWLVTA